MMKKYISVFIVCAFAGAALHAQHSITFAVENLKRDSVPVPVYSYTSILKDLMTSDAGLSEYEAEQRKVNFPYNIIAKSNITDSLANGGYHAFISGMYYAYAHHRPFTISPDMIWLLITQGFARHIANHAEELRGMFVHFSGRQTLVVNSNEIDINNPESHWDKVFSDFKKQIAENTGQQLMDVLTPDFSTTTQADKIAADITIMEAMKVYFDFAYTHHVRHTGNYY